MEDKQVQAGHTAWAVLVWQAQAPVDYDLNASLYLDDEAGH